MGGARFPRSGGQFGVFSGMLGHVLIFLPCVKVVEDAISLVF
jgi:hypothetical protein